MTSRNYRRKLRRAGLLPAATEQDRQSFVQQSLDSIALSHGLVPARLRTPDQEREVRRLRKARLRAERRGQPTDGLPRRMRNRKANPTT